LFESPTIIRIIARAIIHVAEDVNIFYVYSYVTTAKSFIIYIAILEIMIAELFYNIV